MYTTTSSAMGSLNPGSETAHRVPGRARVGPRPYPRPRAPHGIHQYQQKRGLPGAEARAGPVRLGLEIGLLSRCDFFRERGAREITIYVCPVDS